MTHVRSLALLVTLAAAGCGEDTTVTQEAPSRVEAVSVRREDPTARFCDVAAPVGEGRALSLPPIEGPAMPGEGWRWINVWATWCAPCIDELPLLGTFRDRMQAEGASVTTYFLSVDQSADTVTHYRESHPGLPESARLADPTTLPTLMSSLGLDAGATIPIHVLVDPSGHIRCARSGSITERDYDTIRAIVSQ
jgi:thiol-disulfide isomerase/thioredoxin